MRWAIAGTVCAVLATLGLVAVFAGPETPPNVETHERAETQLYVQTDPVGATVHVDNQSHAQSPHVFQLSLPPGVDKVLVEIQKDGFQSKAEQITIRGGRVTRVEFQLDPAQERPAQHNKPQAVSPDHEGAIRGVIRQFVDACFEQNTAEALTCVHESAHRNLQDANGFQEMVDAGFHRSTMSNIEQLEVAGNRAIAITQTVDLHAGQLQGPHCLAYTLVHLDDRWLIQDIDPEDPQGKTAELDRFRQETERMRTAYEGAVRDTRQLFGSVVSALTRRRIELAEQMSHPDRREALRRQLEDVMQVLSGDVPLFELSRTSAAVYGDHAFLLAKLTFPEDPSRDHRCVFCEMRQQKDRWSIVNIGVDVKAEIDRRFEDFDSQHREAAITQPESAPSTEAGDQTDVTAETVAPSMGPSHEELLTNPDGPMATLLDLETGRRAANDEFGEDDRKTHEWIRGEKLDILGAVEGGLPGVLLFDAALVEVPEQRWDTITAAEIVGHDLLNQQEPATISTLANTPESLFNRPTGIFQTREGTYGILQVIKATDQPQGVRIRYRLVIRPQTRPTASRLDFRIAPKPVGLADEDSVVTLSLQQIDHYGKQLGVEGPEAGRARGDDFCWYPIQFSASGEFITSRVSDQMYVLLSNRPEEVMISHKDGKRLWSLRQVAGGSDSRGAPSISGEFDSKGTRLMRDLTKRCLKSRLAILVDDRAISAPMVREPISNRFVIQGAFSATEVEQIVRSLLAGMAWRQVDQQGEPLFSVRLVVDKDRMTFEGREMTWEDLPQQLEMVPRRADTTLNIAIATDEISWKRKNEVVDRAAQLGHRFGFKYPSFIGVHPIGSISPQPPPQAEEVKSGRQE